MFLPEGRGKHAYMCARAAAEFMFVHTDAFELHTYSPHENPASKPPRSFGFRYWFTLQDADYYRLNVMDWAAHERNLDRYGRWFHDNLEAAKEAMGSEIPAHEEIPANNRFAGLAAVLAVHGRPKKALGLYNIWALTAGFEPARIVDGPLATVKDDNTPWVIHTGDAVWQVKDKQVEILKCL